MRRYDRRRARMVRRQLARRGIRDPRVLDVMGRVPRERFLPTSMRPLAYRDSALPLQHGQTISQPYIVALMAEALLLDGSERVLEVGTGSGYAAAVYAGLAAEVHTVERVPELAAGAAERLASLGLDRVHVHVGDGSRGWPEEAPFDAVAVAAATPVVPPALTAQLAEGGRLVLPLGSPRYVQTLTRLRRRGPEILSEALVPVRFVPLVPDDVARGGPS